MQPIALTVAQAAQASGMSQDVIRRALNTGELIAHYPTARPIIMIEELRAWITAAPTQSKRRRIT